MKIETIEASSQIHTKFKISSSEFYNFVLNQNELLKLIKPIPNMSNNKFKNITNPKIT